VERIAEALTLDSGTVFLIDSKKNDFEDGATRSPTVDGLAMPRRLSEIRWPDDLRSSSNDTLLNVWRLFNSARCLRSWNSFTNLLLSQ
jgi:hypothetical protein